MHDGGFERDFDDTVAPPFDSEDERDADEIADDADLDFADSVLRGEAGASSTVDGDDAVSGLSMLDSVHRGEDEDAKLAAIDRILEQNDDALFDALLESESDSGEGSWGSDNA
jgi:hypothetical protein